MPPVFDFVFILTAKRNRRKEKGPIAFLPFTVSFHFFTFPPSPKPAALLKVSKGRLSSSHPHTQLGSPLAPH